jgi:hypothetical protein
VVVIAIAASDAVRSALECDRSRRREAYHRIRTGVHGFAAMSINAGTTGTEPGPPARLRSPQASFGEVSP